MSTAVQDNKIEAQNLIRELFPVQKDGKAKASINAAFKHMTKHYEALEECTHRRFRSFWDGDARRIDSFELDALRREKALRDEAETIEELRRTAAFLEGIDPKVYGQAIEDLVYVAHGISLRGENLEE
ncbi:MAG: hypothetical protein COB78_10005 [Hyphomicrobiales bacterium]|nr:MAG: hypothetical protein COB78_10005 [Hyphomicrobiales bacterium]